MRNSALWSLSVLTLMMAACNSNPPPATEGKPLTYQATPVSTPANLKVQSAAKLAEVEQAVKRVFKDGAVVDASHNPHFLAGDFNGDGSQDIAVIVRPVKLDLMNQELPPWLVREPRANRDLRLHLRIEKDEPLLAIIHGYGANEWRDPEATQTFVLKNVVGNDLKVHTGKEFVAANTGRRLPRPEGDLIAENLQGISGYIYYASATYSWYDPNTFKPAEKLSGMVHQRTK
jgi:hypothetical protein